MVCAFVYCLFNCLCCLGCFFGGRGRHLLLYKETVNMCTMLIIQICNDSVIYAGQLQVKKNLTVIY